MAKKREEARALGVDFGEDYSFYHFLKDVTNKDTWTGLWTGFWEGLVMGVRERQEREKEEQENANDMSIKERRHLKILEKELALAEMEKARKEAQRKYEDLMRAETKRIKEKQREEMWERIRSRQFY